MYVSHFGLRLLPFENVPDPAFFFEEGGYQRILRRLTSAIGTGRGLMVVAGPIGSGKTTLSQKLMAGLPESTVHLWLAEPPGSDRELFQMLLQRLGARLTWDSRVLALGVLRDQLLRLHTAGGQCLVVVDESHKLSDEGLEAIRLLNNLEQGASKLIQVLLLGQEELTEMLTRAGREAFRQRIANMEVLGRMTPPQVRDYVRHRLRVAGGAPGIFPDLILDAIAEAGTGIPRLTNSLCDRALRNAFEGGKSAVDAKDLLQAAEEVGVYRKAFHFLVGRERGETAQAAAAEPVGPPSRQAPFAAPLPTPAATETPAVAPVAQVFEMPRATAAAPAPWPTETAAGAGGILPFAEEAEKSHGVAAEPPRLTGPLLLLAAGVAALAASLLFYCSRATAFYGGDCLAHLVRDLMR